MLSIQAVCGLRHLCAPGIVPVATYGCESWTLRTNEETRLDVFDLFLQATHLFHHGVTIV